MFVERFNLSFVTMIAESLCPQTLEVKRQQRETERKQNNNKFVQ